MASVQFQIHTDKENAPRSLGHKVPIGNIKGGKAKTFQDLKTPRRALGSVNEASRVGGKAPFERNDSVSALKKGHVSTEKDFKLKQRQQLGKENGTVKKGKQKEEKNVTHQPVKQKQQQQAPLNDLPEIEYMPPPCPPRDDDEDMLPLKDRASTYVHKLLNWRPQCLFGLEPDSEEEDEKERWRIMEELDILPLPHDDLFPPAELHLSCEELDLDTIELPNMDDIPLPFIDDDVPEVQGAEELSMSALDDSLGLACQLGSLKLRDESLPSTPSH